MTERYVYVPLTSHHSHPEGWHSLHAEDDELFERPLFGRSMKEAEKILDNQRKENFSSMRTGEFNFKIEKMPLSTFIAHEFRHKKSSKPKPKRKTIKKCKCK